MILRQLPPLAETPAPLDLLDLGVNLALVLLLSWLLGWHFVRFGQVLSPKRKFARVLVFVSATTLLIISVVKVSLALSLGLVGALSIVRFRTPIKEPEELAYLFLAVAIGVGIGADRRYETGLAVLVILLAMSLRRPGSPGRGSLASVLQVHCVNPAKPPDVATLLAAVTPHCAQVDLRRVDAADDVFRASLFVEFAGPDHLQAVIDGIRQALPGAAVSIVDRTTLE
ncbi:MAG: DUF4956 domain-containing protein [Planctomycetota bacterium]